MHAHSCLCVHVLHRSAPLPFKRGGGSQNFGGPKGGGRKIFLKRGRLGESLGVSKKGGWRFLVP